MSGTWQESATNREDMASIGDIDRRIAELTAALNSKAGHVGHAENGAQAEGT